MAEGKDEFVRQLGELGVELEQGTNENRIVFLYMISMGVFAGQTVKLGLEIPEAFPRTPPSGPHISPALLPLNPSAPGHPERTAQSPFGPNWQYWSRPFPNWGSSKPVAAYLSFLDHLFETVV